MKNLTVIAFSLSDVTEGDKQKYPEIDHALSVTAGYVATIPTYILHNFSLYAIKVYTKEYHPSFSEQQLTVAALNALAEWLNSKNYFHLMLCVEPAQLSLIKKEVEAVEFEGRINSAFSDDIESERIPYAIRKVITAQAPGCDELYVYIDTDPYIENVA
ncbi:MAG: hypothetical protein V4478_01185 [Patescibacteria group bacterium]